MKGVLNTSIDGCNYALSTQRDFDVNGKELVRRAVVLAKKQGVLFDENSPTFRPKDSPERFHISFQINTTPLSSGLASLDDHFNALEGFNEITLANRFIRIFNELNIARKAKEIK